MKRNLSLINLSHEEEMYRDEMKEVSAGFSICSGSSGCACGCVYENQGGSSSICNAGTNNSGGLHSTGYSSSNSSIEIGEITSFTCN